MKRKFIVRLAMFMVLCSILNSSAVYAAGGGTKKSLVISTLDNRPLSVDRLVFTAFADIGIAASFEPAVVGQTSYEATDRGEIDGVIASTPNMLDTYPNLRQVPAPVTYIEVIPFLREGSNLKINGWDDLTGLNVGILTNRIYIKNQIPGDAVIYTRETIPSLFTGLQKGAYDVVILMRRSYETIYTPDGIADGESFDSLPEYLYVYKNYEHLIPGITNAIENIYEDGRGEKILKDIPVNETNTDKNILHITSSNTEILREQRFIAELRNQFADDESIEWYTFTFDAGRYKIDDERRAYYAHLLRDDYISKDLTAIIVSGEEAFDFISEYYFLLFRNVPVFFYGVCESRGDDIARFKSYFTGITQHLSAAETIERAVSLFPGTKNIFVLNDYTLEGSHYKMIIEQQASSGVPDGVNIEYSENEGIKQLLARVKELPKDSLVLAGSYFRDGNGQYYSQSEMKRLLENNCSAPVFTMYSTDPSYNAIGGKCQDYVKYAGIIADMMKKLFAGADISDIPIVSSAEYNRWVFDNDMMKKFGVSEKSLPAGAEIINKLPPLWESNPGLFIALAGLFVAGIAIAVVVAVFITVYHKQRELLSKDEKIKEVKDRLERVISTSPVSFMITVDGKVVEINGNMKHDTGLDVGDNAERIYLKDDDRKKIIERMNREGSVRSQIIQFRNREGNIRRAIANYSPIEYGGENAVVSWASDIEELEMKKDELRDARESLQTIIDTMPVPMAIVDGESFKTVYANIVYANMLGFDSPDDILGLPVVETLAPVQESGRSPDKICSSVFSSPLPAAIEIQLLSKTGKLIYVRNFSAPIIYQGKKSTIGIMIDLAGEKEQRKMQESLQLILDTMPVPVRIVDIETEKIVYMNNNCMMLFEIDSPEEGYSKLLSDMLPEYQSDGTPSSVKIEKIKKIKQLISMEVEYITAKGNVIETLLNTAHISYNGKEVSVGIIRDFADVKRLERSRQSLQTVLDTLPVPIRIFDIADDMIIYANNAAFNLFEVEQAPDIYRRGMTGASFMPEVQPDGTNSMELLRNMSRSEPTSAEFVCFKQSGELFDVLFTSCLIDYQGKKASLGIMTDLTAEKEYRSMLMNMAEKEKEANQLKSRFLVNMSHEIRTPMNAIIGLTEIELRRDLPGDAFDIYTKINTSAKNLLTIINDILDLSKIEADKIELYEDEIELEEVIDSALLVAAPRLDGKEVEFLLNASLQLPRYIRGDRTRLWQILKNFLDNSAKYTEKGKIVLTVFENIPQSDDETIRLTFLIEDTGIGMAEDQVKRLFTPYFQIYNNAQKKYTGTGLGMAISKHLCELMGGSMQIESEEGRGTTIILNIPFKRSRNSETEMQAVKFPEITGMNILAVDDDELSLSIMSELITGSGAVCELACSGEEALKIILENKKRGKTFDLILLDYMMEGINGLETAKLIQTSFSKAPKLLMVTAYQKLLLKQELELYQIEDVIEKPFIPSQFIRKILEVLGLGENVSKKQKEKFAKFENVNVLLCEDYKLNYEVAAGMFAQFGVDSTLAENGKEGLELLYSGKNFDLIFMDLQMPVMDGYEAARAIRSDKRFDGIPIISLTADAMKEVVDKCREAGMDDHISKPISFAGLQKIFLKWLPESKRSPENPDTPEDTNTLNDGISRFGNKSSYENALRQFAKDLPEKWTEFKIAVQDMEQTKKFVHKIKGASGNLSETDIYRYAVAFEISLRNGKPDNKIYEKLITASDIFKKRILEQKKEENNAGITAGTAKEFKENLTELEKALRDYDMQESFEAVNRLKNKIWAAVDENKLSRLYEFVQNFEYEQALEIIESMEANKCE